eukprot:gene35100-13497_t
MLHPLAAGNNAFCAHGAKVVVTKLGGTIGTEKDKSNRQVISALKGVRIKQSMQFENDFANIEGDGGAAAAANSPGGIRPSRRNVGVRVGDRYTVQWLKESPLECTASVDMVAELKMEFGADDSPIIIIVLDNPRISLSSVKVQLDALRVFISGEVLPCARTRVSGNRTMKGDELMDLIDKNDGWYTVPTLQPSGAFARILDFGD